MFVCFHFASTQTHRIFTRKTVHLSLYIMIERYSIKNEWINIIYKKRNSNGTVAYFIYDFIEMYRSH